MEVQVLYDQGSASVPEDGIIFQPPFFFGVTDGITGVYLPQEGPRLFNGRTGGQLASSAVSSIFASTFISSSAFGVAIPGESLEDILRVANGTISRLCEKYRLKIHETELLPSAAFVVAKIDTSEITIMQGGDCLAIWQTKDGTLGGTPNKTCYYEKDLLDTIARLMEKHQGDRSKMWEEFRPYLIEKRRANINTEQGGFALLNGQPEFENFWQKFVFPREEIIFLVLFSDGLVPFEWTRQELGMAGEIIRLYRKGGLHTILVATRQIAGEKKSLSHEDYPEATAIAIEF